MNAKVEKAGTSPADMAKLAMAVLLLIAGIVGYYLLGNWTGWARVGVVSAGIIAAVALTSFTAVGRSMREYLSESRFELRKVVWPTRDETLRTTLVVIAVVIILSLLLGLIDVILKWIVLDNLLSFGS